MRSVELVALAQLPLRPELKYINSFEFWDLSAARHQPEDIAAGAFYLASQETPFSPARS
jgi:hypothetical protein